MTQVDHLVQTGAEEISSHGLKRPKKLSGLCADYFKTREFWHQDFQQIALLEQGFLVFWRGDLSTARVVRA
jgi:hypothetical protein